jgi:FkbM family methyltransferase
MENSNPNPLLLKHLIENGHFQEEPFVYLDVGCSGGINEIWRLYKDQIEVHGFDPQQSEINKLRTLEKNPNISYHPYYIGITSENEYSNCFYTQGAWERSSAPLIAALGKKNKIQSNPIFEDLVTTKISLDDFIEQLKSKNGAHGADFIKIDCDGGDLEALMSCKKNLASMEKIIGLMVECSFTGPANFHANTFHNIDRVLKAYEYQPYAIETYRYSRAALPRTFVYDICAQTKSGPVVWGDVLFILDAGATNFEQKTGSKLTNVKLLKLASVFDLFNLPDCAAELLINYRSQLEKEVNVDLMLDILTKEIAPEFEGYAAYMEALKNNPSMLFPKNVGIKVKEKSKSLLGRFKSRLTR